MKTPSGSHQISSHVQFTTTLIHNLVQYVQNANVWESQRVQDFCDTVFIITLHGKQCGITFKFTTDCKYM